MGLSAAGAWFVTPPEEPQGGQEKTWLTPHKPSTDHQQKSLSETLLLLLEHKAPLYTHSLVWHSGFKVLGWILTIVGKGTGHSLPVGPH